MSHHWFALTNLLTEISVTSCATFVIKTDVELLSYCVMTVIEQLRNKYCFEWNKKNIGQMWMLFNVLYLSHPQAGGGWEVIVCLVWADVWQRISKTGTHCALKYATTSQILCETHLFLLYYHIAFSFRYRYYISELVYYEAGTCEWYFEGNDFVCDVYIQLLQSFGCHAIIQLLFFNPYFFTPVNLLFTILGIGRGGGMLFLLFLYLFVFVDKSWNLEWPCESRLP